MLEIDEVLEIFTFANVGKIMLHLDSGSRDPHDLPRAKFVKLSPEEIHLTIFGRY